MILYLVRHGQSEGNVATYDIPDGWLTPTGHQQAEETARRLEGEGLDLLITSPIRRVVQTALATKERTNLPLEVWQHLWEYREQAYFPALGRRGIRELVPDAAFCEHLPEAPWDCGMETPETGYARALEVFQRIQARFGHTDKKIAVFAHGNFNAFFLMALMGRPRQPGCWVEQLNCCINRVYIEPERVRVLSMNDVAHLTVVT